MPSFVLAKSEETRIMNAWFALEAYMSRDCSIDRFVNLKSDHSSALNSSEESKKIWVGNLVTFLRECTYGGYPEGMMAEDARSVLALPGLFWRGNHKKSIALLRQQLEAQKVFVSQDLIDDVQKIETPEQACPTVLMLNAATSIALRPSKQASNTCYVHAAVKAADYYNYSRGTFTDPTSTVATIVGVGKSRTGDLAALGSGHPSWVISYLEENGGCKANALDKIGEKNLELADSYLPRSRSENSKTFLPRLDLMIQKTFCQGEKNRFDGLQTQTLFEQMNGVPDAELRDTVRRALDKEQPQPLIVGFCSEAFMMESGSRPFGCSDHAALIVGQRFDHQLNQCTYQILNSWGSSPVGYLPTYKFEPKYGAVWIPSDVLGASLKGLWKVGK